MINLLPNTYKAELRAARTNTLLIRYISILGTAVLLLSALIGGSYAVLSGSQASAQAAMEASDARVSKYSETVASAESLRTDLAAAKSLLDQKISYTKLIYAIADSMPPGVVLTTLDLDPATFSSSLTINASAKSFESASKLKDKFASRSDIFSNVKLLSMASNSTDNPNRTSNTGSETSVSSGDYPVKVSISVVINKGAL